MATVIDISNKIKNEEKFVVYQGKHYKVNDSKNTVLQVQALLTSAKEVTIETVDQAMTYLIGADAVRDFEGFCYEDYLVPFFAVMACVQGKSYEETEKAFRAAI